MKGEECVAFLQWALPRLRLRWPGFRRVRGQVCKRIGRRLAELGLDGVAEYRRYLVTHADEWQRLDAMCRITISRFYRDRHVFEAIGDEVLPALASAALKRGDGTVRAWSCGCASGEEAYTLAMLWIARLAGRMTVTDVEVTATEADPAMLERARQCVYTGGSIRELPEDLRAVGLDCVGERFRIRDSVRARVAWSCQDVRSEVPTGPFDLVLCRNLVLTYFDDAMQVAVMSRVAATIRVGGALVIGSHERLPELDVALEPWGVRLPVYRRVA